MSQSQATSARGKPAAPERERKQKPEALAELKAQDVLCAHTDVPGSSVSSTGLRAGISTAELPGEHLHPSASFSQLPSQSQEELFWDSTPAQMAFPSLESLVNNQICINDSAFPVQLCFLLQGEPFQD